MHSKRKKYTTIVGKEMDIKLKKRSRTKNNKSNVKAFGGKYWWEIIDCGKMNFLNKFTKRIFYKKILEYRSNSVITKTLEPA